MKKDKSFYFKLNTKPEKIIAGLALSIATAILFDENKKKSKHPDKYRNFIQRTSKNYKYIDTFLAKTIAKESCKKSTEQYKSKQLQNLQIESGEFIDI